MEVINSDNLSASSTVCQVLVYSAEGLRIKTHPWPLTKNVNDSASMIVEAEAGSGVYYYDWIQDNASSGITTQSTNWSAVQTTDAGRWRCIVTDSLGNTAESLSAELTVLPAGTPSPQYFIDHTAGENSYLMSLNANGAGFASLLSSPRDLPDGCDFGAVTAIGVFHRLSKAPYTVIETQPFGGIPITGESERVSFTGIGVDWIGTATNFNINSLFEVNFFFKTNMTGEKWLWSNTDCTELWINSTVKAPTASGVFTVDLRP
jgi:hypothetical protein